MIETTDNSTALPTGWVWATLGDVLKIRNGYAFKSSDYRTKGILLVRQGNLGEGKISLAKAVYVPAEYLIEFKDFTIRKGDVLIGMSGSIGKLCVYDLDKPALQNQRTGLLQVTEPDMRRFVRHYFSTLERVFSAKSKGVGVQNISAKDISTCPCPLPPLAEQKRIVAKIEELFTKLDAGVEALKKVKAELKRYRQAVLKHAFEGKLTEQWREKNKDKLLPAPAEGKYFVYVLECDDGSLYKGYTKDLRERWRQHLSGRAAEWTKKHKPIMVYHWEEYETLDAAVKREKFLKSGRGRKWLAEQAERGGLRQAGEPASRLLERIAKEREKQNSGKKQKKLPPLDKSNLLELPNGWEWASIRIIGDLVSGQHILKKNYNFDSVGMPYLTGPADFGPKHPTISRWTTTPKTVAHTGDVLVTVKGAGVGKTNICNLREVAISRQLMAIRAKLLDEHYVYYFVQLNFQRFQRLGAGSTIPGIDREGILNAKLPLASRREQTRIVEEIERHFSIADGIEQAIEKSLKQSDRLGQSILKKAFEGKLVPQDPTDEPATRLLERIKAVRKSAPASRRIGPKYGTRSRE